MRHRIALALAFLLIAGNVAADEQQTPSDDKELKELLSIVQQETDVATKTRLNSDYVPGIVTVLEGEELEALGVRDAGEAPGLVPGVQSIRDSRASELALV